MLGIYTETGTCVASYEYDAWGNLTSSWEDASCDAVELSPFRYRGYIYDEETGLYALRARYYDPETGRFISPDTLSNLTLSDVNGLNLYAYCLDDPVNYVDPDGELGWLFWAIVTCVVLQKVIGIIAGKQEYVKYPTLNDEKTGEPLSRFRLDTDGITWWQALVIGVHLKNDKIISSVDGFFVEWICHRLMSKIASDPNTKKSAFVMDFGDNIFDDFEDHQKSQVYIPIAIVTVELLISPFGFMYDLWRYLQK